MSVYQIEITKRAQRDIKRLDPDVRSQILQAIDELAYDPRPQSSKKMKGIYKGSWRKRTGDYRIIYDILDYKLQISVVRAGHRKNIY